MDFWTRGEAPTFEEFARSWTKAKAEEHRLLTPEYAYLTDLRHQRAGGDWKAVRRAKRSPLWRRWRESLPFERPTAASPDRPSLFHGNFRVCRSLVYEAKRATCLYPAWCLAISSGVNRRKRAALL